MLSERLGQMSDLDIINVTHKRDGADPSLVRICSIAPPESVAIDRVNHWGSKAPQKYSLFKESKADSHRKE